jgi:hypothetical protein
MAISRAAAAALAVAIAALCLAAPAAGFYLPGVAPNDFQKVRPARSLSPTSLGVSISRPRRVALASDLAPASPDLRPCGLATARSGCLASWQDYYGSCAMRTPSGISADVIAELRWFSFQTVCECPALGRQQRHVVWLFRNGSYH